MSKELARSPVQALFEWLKQNQVSAVSPQAEKNLHRLLLRANKSIPNMGDVRVWAFGNVTPEAQEDIRCAVVPFVNEVWSGHFSFVKGGRLELIYTNDDNFDEVVERAFGLNESDFPEILDKGFIDIHNKVGPLFIPHVNLDEVSYLVAYLNHIIWLCAAYLIGDESDLLRRINLIEKTWHNRYPVLGLSEENHLIVLLGGRN